MDYYSFDSEVIESLNRLRPPVKRGSGNKNRDYSVFCNSAKNNFQVLREFGHKITAKGTNSFKQPNHEESSTSLILKKTSESQILKQCSVVSYASLRCEDQSPLRQNKQPAVKDKPLIQVTVIPKSDQNAGSKLFRKQRIVTKTIHTTSSNHENSIQTKHVYLVVAGRKKEKIYEIKTTGSEKFDKEFIKDDTIENLGHFKQFIKTLNMERKRKKEKRKDSLIDKRNETQVNICETRQSNVEHVCKCSPSPEEDVIDVRPGKSRVRIFGRIGLTEDDKYVLKCQATVDDQPVPTSLSTAENQLYSSSLAAYSKNAQTSCQKIGGVACMRGVNQDTREDIRSLRDSIMQTDFRNNAVNELLLNIDNKNRISKESQSTQVNFNKPGNSMNKTSPFRTSEQVTRCNCSNTDYPFVKTIDNTYDYKNLKRCQSPLVIISVFPKQDNNLTDVVQTVQCAQIENKRALYPENITASKIEITKTQNKMNTTKNSRNRSPSPKGAAKTKINKTVETHVKKGSRNDSPLRSKVGKKDTKKGINSPKQNLQFFNSNTKKDSMEIKRKTSPPRSPRVKTPPASPKREPQNKNASRQSLKPKAKSPKRKIDKGVNTEHLKTKKALVDSYTNKITEQMNVNKHNPDKNVSTISINIDSDNEYYDVLYTQNKFTTDLKVRKTLKEASAQKTFDENGKNGSMENFFPNMSKKHKRNSVCRSVCQNLSDDLKNNTPRLTVRDSLEIGHRREDKAMKITQTQRPDSKQLTVNSDDMEFLAPIKHFTGDNCTICDPVERDTEIRELLGVEGRKVNSPFKDPQSQVFGDQISRHCFYSKQCERTFVAGFALNNVTPCECVGDAKKCNDANCDQSDFKMQYDTDDSDKSKPLLDQKNTASTSIKQIERTNHKETTRKIVAEQKHQQNIDECDCIGETKKCTLENCKNNRLKVEDSCPCIGVSRKCNIPTCDNKSLKTQEKNDKTELPTQKNTEDSNSMQKDVNNKINDEENVARENKVNSSNQYEVPNLDKTSLYQQLTLNRNIQIFLQVEQFAKQKPIVLSKKQYNKIKKTIQHTIIGKDKSKRCVCNRSIVSVQQKNGKPAQDVLVYSNREVQTDTYRKEVETIKESKRRGKSKKRSKKEKELVETVVLFSNETRGSMKDKKLDRVIVKRAASSMEIRNASVAYWKHVTFSSTNVGSIGSSSFAKRNQNSIETIFRGHKKSLTPNLGTSAFSLLSEARISESQSLKPCSPDAKIKKPFLRRLMSCLVMRSARASEKIPGPVDYPPSENSSVDSYHISTSLGGIEMTSSIYDTSASFYSDHSIHPLSSKLKRSFFTSVRGFLTSRKS